MHLSGHLALFLALALLAAAGCEDPAAELTAKRRAGAQATLDQASQEIRERLTLTCERWQDEQNQCDAERVYASVLDCWIEKGLPHLESALDHGIRQRARNRRVVMHHSLCMERHGWRLVPGSGGYF